MAIRELLQGKTMKDFIRVMKALSDPNRVRILKLLGTKEFCVCELQDLVALAQSTVSKHMKLLEEAGLVDFRKEGSWIIYRLSKSEESAYARVMLDNLSEWLDSDPQLQEMLLRVSQVDRERICAA
jgi:ArsR family transcriptional regulator, arsenate/arsenite/antimonite-responsive transcriptional repressor